MKAFIYKIAFNTHYQQSFKTKIEGILVKLTGR